MTLETLAKNGMTVGPPSAQLKADLKKIGDTITADWVKSAGRRRQGDRRRVSRSSQVVRKALDFLYDAAALARGVFRSGRSSC